MARVTVVREDLPPIREVTLTMSYKEALALAAVLGQFGDELPSAGLYREFGAMQTKWQDDVEYREMVREVKKAITHRAEYIKRYV
jgi:hypothetical protein